MNFRIIFKLLGILLIIESLFMSLSIGVSLSYGASDYVYFIYSAVISFSFGFLLFFINRKASVDLGKKEGFFIVSTVWVVFSVFGSLPFFLSGAINSYTDAFFETISGFTTTGASVLNNIEELSKAMLFWRSIIQWIGGMGIIVLTLAILPILGVGGMQLFIAEVPGITPDKLHPRIKETAKRLWAIYLLFTIAETVLLKIGGMSLFDAVCHSFTTMATGGYSTKQASITAFNSPFIEYVIIVFMFLAGVNFTLSYFALHLRFKKVFKNEEFRFYFFLVLIFTIIIASVLYFNESMALEQSFRTALFQVVSIATTTGFATANYLLWSPFLVVLIFVLMFVGGSAGSTAGGIKQVRILLMFKNIYAEIKKSFHTNAFITVKFNGKNMKEGILSNVLAFVILFLLFFVLGTILMSMLGLDFESATGSVIACLGNIGPGIGSVGPAENFADIPDVGKWILSFFMLLGRLEIFTVLVILTPFFWKK